jgi:hypothetical protein
VFNANAFIEQAGQEIADLKRHSMYYRLAFCAMTVIGPALGITGLIKGFALSPDLNSPDPFKSIFPRIGVGLWNLLGENIPTIWVLLLTVSPYPRMTQPVPLVSWIGWGAWCFGIGILTRGLRKRADTLKADAAEARKTLKLQAPLLQAMAHAQSNRIGDVSGDQNVINAVNTINNVLHQSKDQSSSGAAWGLIISIIGVVVNIISLFIHPI